MAAEADCECPACGLQQVETRPFNTGIDPVKGATVATTTSTITDQFLSRTQGSARLAERARKVFPGGLTHDSRYLQPYPLYVTHAAGSH